MNKSAELTLKEVKMSSALSPHCSSAGHVFIMINLIINKLSFHLFLTFHQATLKCDSSTYAFFYLHYFSDNEDKGSL